MTVRDWLTQPMTVSYAQVLGNGLVLLTLVWMLGTLALWLRELGRQLKVQRRIENHLVAARESLSDQLHLWKRDHHRLTMDLRVERERRFRPRLGPPPLT
jgi:uncharacterized membrane protein